MMATDNTLRPPTKSSYLLCIVWLVWRDVRPGIEYCIINVRCFLQSVLELYIGRKIDDILENGSIAYTPMEYWSKRKCCELQEIYDDQEEGEYFLPCMSFLGESVEHPEQ